MEWADAVLFLNWDTRVAESRNGKPRGVGGRVRVIHTTHSAGWDAKVRVDLPEKLPCEFGALAPLFGPQQEEVKEKGPVASAPSSSENTAATTSSESQDQLLDVIGDMDKDDVRGYLVSRKLIPEDGFIHNLSENQVKWIVEHAAKFCEQVQKFAKEPY
jgi:hypothetical protein